MSLRVLLALLPAFLAPLGAAGELSVTAGERGILEWSEAEVRSLVGAPEWDTSSGSGPSAAADGEPSSRLPTSRTRAGAAAGSAVRGHAARAHLERCGHDAGRLDLPPPPRD